MADRKSQQSTRREFLRTSGAVVAAGMLPQLGRVVRGAEPAKSKLKVAAVFTEFSPRSHAHVILENFLGPYYFCGQETDPGCEVVSFYADQFPKTDMARDVAKDYKIPIYPSINDALCLGGKDLAVDAVLSIGEHGTYPRNAKEQTEYPRKRFFDEIVAVLKKSKRSVPVFNDKHLSYRWDWAKEMYDTARELKIPFMAGSSVPLAQRIPPLEIPDGAKIVEAVSIHGGGLDSYDFHGYEVLQSMVENRAGGETGVASVQYLAEDALWKAAEKGLWSPELANAAWKAEPQRKNGGPSLTELLKTSPWGLLVTYRDGLRGMCLKVADGTRWNFACKLADKPEPVATSFYVGPWQNRNLFKALSHAIQAHFRNGESPYPLERTLLTTGLVEAGVNSHYEGDKVFETPHLDIKYQPRDYRAYRENGASWKLITEEMPEPKGIHRLHS